MPDGSNWQPGLYSGGLVVTGFEPADLMELEPQHQQAMEFAAVGDWRPMIEFAASQGPAWTGRIGGRVIGCAGAALLWRGRAHAWSVLGENLPRAAWPALHKAVTRRLAQLPALGIWRLEAEHCAGFAAGRRWLELLGFEREGRARAFGPGAEDFERYARVTL